MLIGAVGGWLFARLNLPLPWMLGSMTACTLAALVQAPVAAPPIVRPPMPMAHTSHFPSSFYPREQKPGHLMIEESFGAETLADLRARGHDLEVAPAWTLGRLVAASRDADGLLHAAATPRLMQAYAAGR